jgi:hypothetical protein
VRFYSSVYEENNHHLNYSVMKAGFFNVGIDLLNAVKIIKTVGFLRASVIILPNKYQKH